MSGTHLTTISPSSTSSSRSTPWVEGCCGPNEMVICVSSGRSTTSNCGGRFVVDALIFRSSLDCCCRSLKSLLREDEVVSQNARDLHRRAAQDCRRELRLTRRCHGRRLQERVARDRLRRYDISGLVHRHLHG